MSGGAVAVCRSCGAGLVLTWEVSREDVGGLREGPGRMGSEFETVGVMSTSLSFRFWPAIRRG
jgi:hypothetical protein